jgi:peptide/nickel transport system permease protein
MVEKKKDYVSAARLFALPSRTIMVRHILPNVMSPVLVILTINFGLAIITSPISASACLPCGRHWER